MIFPEYKLADAKRIRFERHHWKKSTAVMNLLNVVADKFAIKDWTDWYTISSKHLELVSSFVGGNMISDWCVFSH